MKDVGTAVPSSVVKEPSTDPYLPNGRSQSAWK